MKWKLVLFLAFLICASSVSGRLIPPDAEALLEIKSSLGDPHGLLAGWDPDGVAHHCSWPGVSCDPARGLRVVSLNVSGRDDPLQGGRKLGGKLSPGVGRLKELRVLWLPFNELGGEVPFELWGLEKLEILNLEGNLFSGFGGGGPQLGKGMCKLRVLNLGFNRLGRVIPGWLSQCGDLEVLDFSGNRVHGRIPRFVFGFVELRELYLGGNELSGSVPDVPGEGCQSLEHLDLSGNSLIGWIPAGLGRCSRLKTLLLYSNVFTGVIPRELGQLRRLEVLDVSRNFIQGRVPAELGKCTSLSVVVLSNLFETWPVRRNVSEKVKPGLVRVNHGEHNRFRGSIPIGITTLPHLRVLWAPGASLGGKLSSNWGECTSLEIVNLAHNELFGEIDGLLLGCKRLHHLDLSSNRLNGKLDKKLPAPCMTYFDVGRNLCSGLKSRFNYCGSSLALSSSLSAFQLPQQDHKNGVRSRSLAAIDTSSNDGSQGFTPIQIAFIVSASAVVFVLLSVAVLVFCSRKRIPDTRIQDSEPREIITFVEIGVPLSYESIVQSTGNFNASNCIGSGGFGATYKAEISPGTLVAVKRLATGRVQGVQQFHAEISALGLMKHRNLVTLIGYHASEAEMFLIYNYLAGGNLADFIKERSARAGNWKIIHKIALDIAYALAYLHDECSPRVLHRDIKPSNILLDGDCNAYLSDFGLSRLMGNSVTHVTTGVHGTYGYVSPEYALTNRVSDKSDVYSYGVVLLELVSDKRALDPSFSAQENGYNIVSWASILLRRGKAKEVFTPNLWGSGPHDDLVKMLHLAISCTAETHSYRPTMKDVVRRLKHIRPILSLQGSHIVQP